MLASAGQPASAREAIAAVTAGLGFLARADAASMDTAAQAECLKGAGGRGGHAHRGQGKHAGGV
jgi:hypothetical protein